MLKKLMLLCCILSGVSSCYKYNKPKKPEGLIPKDKMVHVLLDLKLIASIGGVDKKVLDSAKVYPEAYIYKKYDIDSLQFAQSNTYYAYYIDDYREMYKAVKDSLDKLKAHYKRVLDDEEEEKQRKKDSIKNLKKDLENLKELKDSIDIEPELIVPASDKN